MERLEKGTLKMNGWVFKIATGEVVDYDPVAMEFVPFEAPPGDSLPPPAPSGGRV
jgi:carbonic anhydrase